MSPLFNEVGNVGHLVERVTSTLRSLPYPYEIVLVDDGSSDGTWEAITAISATNPAVRGIRLSRNFGHQFALLAGLNAARGDAVVSLDGDLQHPPEAIPELVSRWKQGFKIVLTRRRDSHTVTRFKKATSKYFYRVFSLLADSEITEGTSDFRLLDRVPLQQLLQFRDSRPFLRASVNLLGFPKTVVDIDVGKRLSGQSKYPIRAMLRFARQGLISHSSAPLRFGIWIGLATSLLAFAELLYIVIQVILGDAVPGWASAVGVTSLLFGILFLNFGVLGVYVADIHALLKHRPLYIVAEDTAPRPMARSQLKDDEPYFDEKGDQDA